MKRDDEFLAVLRRADETLYCRSRQERVRCPSIPAMADYIRSRWPHLYVSVEPHSETKDRHPKGVRWRIPGRRRYHGRRLTVAESLERSLRGDFLLQHDTTETYRRNIDVARWIIMQADGRFGQFDRPIPPAPKTATP